MLTKNNEEQRFSSTAASLMDRFRLLFPILQRDSPGSSQDSLRDSLEYDWVIWIPSNGCSSGFARWRSHLPLQVPLTNRHLKLFQLYKSSEHR